MDTTELKMRTKKFALRIIQLINDLPNTRSIDVISRQLLRSATSVGANYRAACRARSTADFLSKITIVEEEADESQYWLELLENEAGVNPETLMSLWQESKELTAIFTATGRTTRENSGNSRFAIRNTTRDLS